MTLIKASVTGWKLAGAAVGAALLSLASIACGGPSNSASNDARPTSDEIDHRCDPYEDAPGLGKECHDLGENKTTPEQTCIAKREACLNACPKK